MFKLLRGCAQRAVIRIKYSVEVFGFHLRGNGPSDKKRLYIVASFMAGIERVVIFHKKSSLVRELYY